MAQTQQRNMEYEETLRLNQQGGFQQDSTYSSHSQIEAKCSINLPPPVLFAYNTNLAQDLLNEFKTFQTSDARIVGSSYEEKFQEFPQLVEEAVRDQELKLKEQEKLTQEFERELARRSEAYRKQAEGESEKIRTEVEKQRQKDIDLRKQLAELAIENQKRKVDIESKYAKRDLDRQSNLVRETLEKSRSIQDVQVNLETAVGHTESGAHTVGLSEKEQRQQQQQQQRRWNRMDSKGHSERSTENVILFYLFYHSIPFLYVRKSKY